MNILTRYLIRAHVAPFFFSLTVLTGLFFLNLVALRMGALMGKGLPWQVYAEFMLLSLPHTLALTIPMSVLVAVLYAFSELAEANEITAMSAGGVRPAR
ncbi:MAG: LptF/LptG family permease, partial [Gammaproteobacteria bacterium]|nr:LptF/LptG family permease [Gammaproteobacteria bacterium]